MDAALSLSSAAQAVPDEGVALDDPAEWPAFGHALDAECVDCWESQVVVEGMHCAACAFTVEAALCAVPGVLRAEVNAATRRARVVWSADAVRPSRWFAASAAAGYRLVPAGDLQARARRMREGRAALWRWLVAGFCMMQVMMYAYPAYIARARGHDGRRRRAAALGLVAAHAAGAAVLLPPLLRFAWRDLRHGRIGMDVPVASAS
jgi:Cu2+-exporting ATPase